MDGVRGANAFAVNEHPSRLDCRHSLTLTLTLAPLTLVLGRLPPNSHPHSGAATTLALEQQQGQ